jgi:hypothetical protein
MRERKEVTAKVETLKANFLRDPIGRALSEPGEPLIIEIGNTPGKTLVPDSYYRSGYKRPGPPYTGEEI